MNPRMWANKATQRNLAQLVADGVALVGPNEGEMAEAGERGVGRMAEPLEIAAAVEKLFAASGAAAQRQARAGHLRPDARADRSGALHRQPLVGQAGPRHRRSGSRGRRRGDAGERPGDCCPIRRASTVIKVETAREMLDAVQKALPVDVAIFAAAVADWRVANASAAEDQEETGHAAPDLPLVENPDILATIAHRKSQRPQLVIGFAAETENVAANARAKLARKGCDWILANDVSPATGIMGGDRNTIQLVTANGVEPWPPQSKEDVAAMLMERIAAALAK